MTVSPVRGRRVALCLIPILLVAGSVTAVWAGPDVARLNAIADTWVNSNSPTANYGTATTFWNGSHDAYLYLGYAKFDVTSIADWYHIDSVKLCTYMKDYSYDPVAAHYFCPASTTWNFLHQVVPARNDTWEETGTDSMTWNTAWDGGDPWSSNDPWAALTDSELLAIRAAVPGDDVPALTEWVFSPDAVQSVASDANGVVSLVLRRAPHDPRTTPAFPDPIFSGATWYSNQGSFTGYPDGVGPYLEISGQRTPEPATWVLLAATAVIGALRRRFS